MVRVFVPTVSPDFAAVVSEGVFVPSLFYLADGGDTTAAFAAHVRTLPRVELGPRDRAIPSELASLPPDAEVIHRNGGGDTVGRAGEVARDMQRTINERLGPYGERISLLDLPDALLEAAGQRPDDVPRVSKDALHDRVRQAATSGALRVRHPETDLSEVYAHWPQPTNASLVCSIDDVNEWLAKDGAGYRLLELASEPGCTPMRQGIREAGTVHRAKHQRYTPDDRKQLLKIFRSFEGKRPIEGKVKKNGAIRRTVEKTGIHRDTLGDQLDRAIGEERANLALTQIRRQS